MNYAGSLALDSLGGERREAEGWVEHVPEAFSCNNLKEAFVCSQHVKLSVRTSDQRICTHFYKG